MFSFLLKLLLPAIAFGSGLYVAHHWDAGDVRALQTKIADIERDDARARAQSLAIATERLKRQDAIGLNSAVAEAAAQQKLADENSRVLKDIYRHVTQPVGFCIPLGFVRVLDAASLGADLDTLSLGAGQSDDTCAPVTAVALAANIAANYAAARANAEQLNALEAWNAAQASSSSDAPSP